MMEGIKMMRANRKDEKLLLALLVGLAGISKTEGTRRVFNPSLRGGGSNSLRWWVLFHTNKVTYVLLCLQYYFTS
jgi:hypothetical protein